MRLLSLKNPFGAPIYHDETVTSTFDSARTLAQQGEPHGTVITADFQEAGRGRFNRSWVTERGKNLLFTMLLRYGDFSAIPGALTLRAGLALSLAVEDLAPALAGSIQVKWPNDVMIASCKLAGILAETDGQSVFLGVGVNVTQSEFPDEYHSKAGSLVQFLPCLGEDARFLLLENFLRRFYEEIEEKDASLSRELWRERLGEKLYKKGEFVTFAEGAEERLVEGTLSGIGPGGELLIIPKGEKTEKAFTSGELRVYSRRY
jgi:BirA family biotin operon repressor/biotin-[acetyl-CoA-carboxylase] ligase